MPATALSRRVLTALVAPTVILPSTRGIFIGNPVFYFVYPALPMAAWKLVNAAGQPFRERSDSWRTG